MKKNGYADTHAGTQDFAGNLRTNGTIDIGAFEWR
jgi:hypothetical protein